MNIRLNARKLLFLNTIIIWGAMVSSPLAHAAGCATSGDGYLSNDDWDGDGVVDALDLCVHSYDPDNDDYDNDGVGDVCDNCALWSNPSQNDMDKDGTGDACDNDMDGDLVLNTRNFAPEISTDSDSAAAGKDTTDTAQSQDSASDTTLLDSESVTAGTELVDRVDTGTDSMDAGLHLTVYDNCPNAYNPYQEDLDGDGQGNACDPDLDGDDVANELDACPFDPAVSVFTDSIEASDVNCFGDSDADGRHNYQLVNGTVVSNDNCPYIENPGQEDLDGDGIGDACDDDIDGDGVVDSQDNCSFESFTAAIEQFNAEATGSGLLPVNYEGWTSETWLQYLNNPLQEDVDRDAMGDSCDKDFSVLTADGYLFANCPVVLGDKENCLRVGDLALQVYSPPVIASKTSDDEIRLRIFANRENETLKYTWSQVGGESEGIVLHRASGIVRCSSAFEYHYNVKTEIGKSDTDVSLTDLSATYETRLSGSYLLKLKVEVLNEKGVPKAGAENTAETYVVINSSGIDDYIADSCGCVAAGHSSSGTWMWILAAMLLGVRLRRRFLA